MKKLSIFLMLMAFFAPLAMNAQETLLVHDGTSTNRYVPFYGYYADEAQTNQMIYPAAELADMDGGEITAMMLYWTNGNYSGGSGVGTWTISIGETSATTLSGIDNTTSLTQVFSGDLDALFNSTDNTLPLTFNTAYSYNGGNLLVQFSHEASSYKDYAFYGETVTGASYCYSSQRNFLPKTTFTYEPAQQGGCPKPTGFAVNYNGGTTAIVTWNGTASQYDIEVNGTVTNNVTSPDTLTNLNLATTYQVRVRANCGGGEYSDYTSSKSFTTDACLAEDMCSVTIELNDAYGDGGGQIQVVNATTNEVLATITNSGASTSQEVSVCSGTQLNFVFASTDSWPYENGWVITGPGGEVISEHVGCTTSGSCTTPTNGTIATYTLNCSGCFNPSNLQVSNVTTNSATLSWNGEAASYTVRYRKAEYSELAEDAFFDDFENGLGNWTLIVNAEGTGWQTFDATRFTGGTNHSGSYVAMARSYEGGVNITADNWMISSRFTSIPNTMTYWAKNDGRDDHLYDETYDVCVSTSSNSTGDFQIVQTFTTTPDTWQQITIDLSAYAGAGGYIAFHHHDAEKDMLLIDDVLIGNVETTPAGEWLELPPTTNNYVELIEVLDDDTEYEYQVMANCEGEDSGWTDINNFHTLSLCSVTPTGLTADVTGNSAELSWTGNADTYDIQYREADPTAPATLILNVPTDIWNDGTGYQLVLDADHNTYGTTIPETGNFTAGTFADFEYTIPENAECVASTTTIVVNGSATITIPAGVYDYVFLNPDPSSGTYYIASPQVFPSRGDDYEFEAGKTYEFTLSIIGSNDAITPTITDNGNAWTLVEGVNNPYTLQNLSSQTTYEWKVQRAGCDNWSATATFTTPEFYIKHIDPYTSDGGFYLIASPVGQINPSEVGGMLDNDYDLYYFDQTKDLEWINYKPTATTDPGFNLEPGKGYLYANSGNNGQGIDLVFAQAAYTGSGQVTLALESGAEFEGMNLVGNPFADTAYIADGRGFYRLAEGGAEVMTEASTGAIEPMEGVFVYAQSADESMTFTTTAPSKKVSRLVLNLTSCNNVIDRAIVRFGEGNMLPKFQLNKNHTKVYMTVEGKDYAVVYSDGMGEMPVNFKAEKNGNYTFNFSSEEVSFGYLHLIDNMNGNDVDLLATPSYSFDAKTTDSESRFTLVFTTGNNDDDTFAFYSNGSFVINNEGNATLQVIDINGRIMKSESINGCANVNVNAAQGIYMLRLVNGDNVKVQKVVVR